MESEQTQARRASWRALLDRHPGQGWLDEPTAKRLLAAAGIPVPRGAFVETPGGQAQQAAPTPPWAVKIVSPDVVHKSDGGGVRLNVGAQELDAVMQAMADAYPQARIAGYLVEEMAAPGVELLLGGVIDPVFGPCVMLGGGGTQAELWQDVAMRLCPVTADDVRDMLQSLRIRPLLAGYRGQPAVDMEAVVRAVLALAGPDGLLCACADRIAAIDVNPLIAGAHGVLAVDARVQLREPCRPGTAGGGAASCGAEAAPATGSAHEPNPAAAPDADLEHLFVPRSVAVVGASADGGRSGNHFLRNLREYGYRGRIYAVHPTASQIDGVPAVASLAALPEPVDYAYIAVPAAAVAPLLAAAPGMVRYAQVMTSGFAEVEGGAALQQAVLDAARAAGTRVIGPNCLGLHSVRGRVTFIDGVQDEEGGLAVISQSGGLGVDILRRGQARGLAFSSLITIGNAADLSVAELLAHHLADPRVRQIALYVESLDDPATILALLRGQRHGKPVVLLKGGTSEQGQAAAASHTGAMASDARLWSAFARQAGMATVQTLDELIDACLALQCLRPRPQRPSTRVALFGNGGGTSVLACDAFARAGFAVPVFGPDTAGRLAALPVPPGASLRNPVDTPVGVLRVDDGALAHRILEILTTTPEVDALVLHLNLPVLLGYADEALIQRLALAALGGETGAGAERPHVLLVLRSDTSAAVDALRRRLRAAAIAAGVPVFDELADAARALACLRATEAALAAIPVFHPEQEPACPR